MDFLFHKVSESEKKEIQKQAKKIIDDFSEQLDKVKEQVSTLPSRSDTLKGIKGKGTSPKNLNEGACNEFDRKTFFENAPGTKGDFIVGEEGKW